MRDDLNAETYRSTCSECSWGYESRYYGTVEREAMAHEDHAGIRHSATEPERVEA